MDVATKSNTGDWESVACPDNYQLLEGLLAAVTAAPRTSMQCAASALRVLRLL